MPFLTHPPVVWPQTMVDPFMRVCTLRLFGQTPPKWFSRFHTDAKIARPNELVRVSMNQTSACGRGRVDNSPLIGRDIYWSLATMFSDLATFFETNDLTRGSSP